MVPKLKYAKWRNPFIQFVGLIIFAKCLKVLTDRTIMITLCYIWESLYEDLFFNPSRGHVMTSRGCSPATVAQRFDYLVTI